MSSASKERNILLQSLAGALAAAGFIAKSSEDYEDVIQRALVQVVQGGTTLVGAGPPTNGVTGAGVVVVGNTYTDSTNGDDYKMRAPGTTANPQWFKTMYEETGS